FLIYSLCNFVILYLDLLYNNLIYFLLFFFFFFFFNDTATTEIYTLSLHDALPILTASLNATKSSTRTFARDHCGGCRRNRAQKRSEEHTSELQSQSNLVCRLLLEKKKKKKKKKKINKKNKLTQQEQNNITK